MSDIKNEYEKLKELIQPQNIADRISTWEQMTKISREHSALKQAVTVIRHFENTIESQKEEIERLTNLNEQTHNMLTEQIESRKKSLLHSIEQKNLIDFQNERLQKLESERNEALEYVRIKQDQIWILAPQIESLRAITELAVNALKEISSMRSGGVNWETDDYYDKFCEVEDNAIAAISEIERLQNE